MNFKKIRFFASLVLTIAISLSSISPSFAFFDEGMFTLDQIYRLPLGKLGLKIKPSDIYDPQNGGISEAVIRLDTGCTGEFVSPDGLILTNHHCGFDALVLASALGRDYGKDGYKADSRAAELPAKGYAISIPKRVEDVTAQILAGTENLTGESKTTTITAKMAQLEAAEKAKIPAGNTVRVQALNNGFFYYLYEYQQIKDIRVVYAPPRSIGFFGGDPDNFEWTRHTGDFTFLRAYVAPDGSAADYSTNNIPFKPRRFLTISLNGLKENDFVFVLGYPGGTTRYRESQAVAYAQNTNYPFIYEYLTAWINGLEKVGETDEAKRISLQSEVFSLANSQKLYLGGVQAMRRGDIIAQKQAEEAKFAAWINANPARRAKYGTLLSDINRASMDYYRTGQRDRLVRTFPNTGNTPVFKQVADAIVAVSQNKSLTDEKRAEIQRTYKDREPLIEREMIKFFLRKAAELPAAQKYAPVENYFGRYQQPAAHRQAEEIFAASIADNKDFDTPEKIFALYGKSLNDLRKDYPNLVDFALAHAQEQAAIAGRTTTFNNQINNLRLLYMQGMSEMDNTRPYPDANFTQRFTYGYIKGYEPREAVIYKPFTTLKGVIEKDQGVEPFEVAQKLKDLQRSRNFGRYGVGDSVPVNFLATTDIIGGNSGSPVMNAYGEQVGIVFDGNYEGLGNDIFYNPNYGRTIAVDIRYVLFVTEKFGNAGWILNEMKINASRPAAGKTARGR